LILNVVKKDGRGKCGVFEFYSSKKMEKRRCLPSQA
jgi:hypothetical protein